MTEYGVAVWSSAAWRDQAVAWLDEQLAATGIERTGEPTFPHVRPWATALRAPTSAGVVWMKAAGPGTAFEVGVYELLARVVPEHMLTPIALDVERAWIVLPDGGVPLGERLSGDELVDAMADVLVHYAQLQRDVAPHVEELLERGVADMRPAALPARFEQALAVVTEYVEGRDVAEERERLRRIAAMRSAVPEWCERLEAAPGEPTLDHHDLHPWNVLTPPGGGEVRFYDWGDALIAHPFTSMLAALDFMQRNVLDTGPDNPRILRLRDAYLGEFADLAPHAELVETMQLACRLGTIARTLVWHRALSAEPRSEDFADAPFETLAGILDDR